MAVDRVNGYPGNESDGGLLPSISLSNSVVSRASDNSSSILSNKRKIRKSESSSGTDSDYISMSSGSPTKLPSLRGNSNSIVSMVSGPRLCRTPSCPQLNGAFDEEEYNSPQFHRIRKPVTKDDCAKDVKLPSIFDKSPGHVLSHVGRMQNTPGRLASQQSNRMTPSTIVNESRNWYYQRHDRDFYERNSPNAYTPNPVPTPALLFPIKTTKEMDARNRKKTKREKKKRRQTTEVQYHELAEVKPRQTADSKFVEKNISAENKENTVRTGQVQDSANIRNAVHGPILVYADGKKHEGAKVAVEGELSLSKSERKCREWLAGVDNPPTTAEREKIATTS